MPDVTEGYYWARIERTTEVEIVQLIPAERAASDFHVLRMGSELLLKLDQVELISAPIPLPVKYL